LHLISDQPTIAISTLTLPNFFRERVPRILLSSVWCLVRKKVLGKRPSSLPGRKLPIAELRVFLHKGT
jgi:hypothetical protein